MRTSILCLALLAASPARAQTAAPASKPPSREALALGARVAHAAQPGLDQGLQTLVDGLATSYRASSAQSGQAVDEKALADVSKSEAEAARPLLWDGMARLYAETYTVDELKALVGYYGQHPGDAQDLPPALAAKSAEIDRRQHDLVAQLGPRILQDFFGDYCSRATCSDDLRRAAGLPVH